MSISGPNAEQADYWSTAGLSWIDNEAAQDAILAPVSGFLVENSGFEPGMRVLDIGCGTGGHALAVAGKVGQGGKVLAVDVSQPSLERVAERAAAAGAPVGTFYGDAQIAGLPGGFDVATSRFGVMFFADPGAALANIARALRPGGRMVFAAWAPVAVNPFWRVPAAVAAARLGRPEASAPNAPGPMGLSDVAFVEAQLARSGLAETSVRTETVVLGHVGGAAEMAAQCLRTGPAAHIARVFDATEADRAAIIADLTEALSDYEDSEGFRMPATLNIIEARAG